MPTIYRTYKDVREIEGYYDARPNFAMFGLGWEAYGALSWNTNQASVLNILQTYLDHGYRFHWGVVGSGFWKGARNNRQQGATISFGIWDDIEEPGRDDSHPNPRYPDVPGLKQFFAANDIRLLIGLRNNFKALPEDGGHYFPENNGPFTVEGLENDFFLTDVDGDPLRVRGGYPSGQLYLLDGQNPDALQWYAEGAELWGVGGFKEDAMIKLRPATSICPPVNGSITRQVKSIRAQKPLRHFPSRRVKFPYLSEVKELSSSKIKTILETITLRFIPTLPRVRPTATPILTGKPALPSPAAMPLGIQKR